MRPYSMGGGFVREYRNHENEPTHLHSLPCSATVIGHGCNTINNPPHPTYRDCCQYWTWKCTGSSQTWKERMLTNGESCTNMGSPEDPLYHCPTAPSQPPTD